MSEELLSSADFDSHDDYMRYLVDYTDDVHDDPFDDAFALADELGIDRGFIFDFPEAFEKIENLAVDGFVGAELKKKSAAIASPPTVQNHPLNPTYSNISD